MKITVVHECLACAAIWLLTSIHLRAAQTNSMIALVAGDFAENKQSAVGSNISATQCAPTVQIRLERVINNKAKNARLLDSFFNETCTRFGLIVDAHVLCPAIAED